MTERTLHLIVPGALEQRTGGYLYNARMVRGLRDLDWSVSVHELNGSFPDADQDAEEAMQSALASIPEGQTVVIDGLAMGGLPGPICDHSDRLRVISLVHHPLAEETGISTEHQRRFRASERAAVGCCAGVIVTSDFTAAALRDFEVPEDRLEVVRPGTSPVPVAEGPGAGQPPALLCVASVTPRKGHDVLIRAMELVRDVPWTCVCVGSLDRASDFTQAVREQIRAAGLDGRVELTGEVSDGGLRALYHASSIFVLASHYEGYGMAIAEAVASGLPVVSTDGGAIPFTAPADAAVLVPPGDAEAFAEALREVLTDDARRAELATAARRHADTLPSWDASARAFTDAIRRLSA
ncbi:MAG: glycosyltransferase family 4 protein [Gemmatimonadota bacterium]